MLSTNKKTTPWVVYTETGERFIPKIEDGFLSEKLHELRKYFSTDADGITEIDAFIECKNRFSYPNVRIDIDEAGVYITTLDKNGEYGGSRSFGWSAVDESIFECVRGEPTRSRAYFNTAFDEKFEVRKNEFLSWWLEDGYIRFSHAEPNTYRGSVNYNRNGGGELTSWSQIAGEYAHIHGYRFGGNCTLTGIELVDFGADSMVTLNNERLNFSQPVLSIK